MIVPRSSLREGREVLLIEKGNKLTRREVEIVWSDMENVVVRNQLIPGEVLCLTPLTYAAEGALVIPHILGESPPKKKKGLNRVKRNLTEVNNNKLPPIFRSHQSTPNAKDRSVVKESEPKK